jgi:hypothetical protein
MERNPGEGISSEGKIRRESICKDQAVPFLREREQGDELAVEKVLNEHAVKIESFGIAPSGAIAHAARSLGYLRWIAKTRNWTIDFKPLNFRAFIDISVAAIQCDPRKMCHEVLFQNPRFGLTEADLASEIERAANTSHNVWQVSQGHDMVTIFAMAVSTRSGRNCVAPAIASELRLAYEMTFFAATRLFLAVCAWQRSNPPFIAFRLKCPEAA